MIIKGVTDTEQDIIDNILRPFKAKYEFYYYGSRVKGDFRFLSDLDILIKSDKEVLSDDIETLKTLFDNSNLPYVVNFTDYNHIDEKFYNIIKNDLIRI